MSPALQSPASESSGTLVLLLLVESTCSLQTSFRTSQTGLAGLTTLEHWILMKDHGSRNKSTAVSSGLDLDDNGC